MSPTLIQEQNWYKLDMTTHYTNTKANVVKKYSLSFFYIAQWKASPLCTVSKHQISLLQILIDTLISKLSKEKAIQ